MLSIRIAGGWFFAMRRVLATICIGLLAVFIGYKAVVGENGMRVWQAKRAEVQRLQIEIDAATAAHQRLQREVDRLQQADPSTIEKVARERLGLVRPGEHVLYEPAPKPDPSQLAQNAGQK
jgi:cell division protein FtsB